MPVLTYRKTLCAVLHFFLITVLCKLQQLIKPHRNDTQKQDGCNEHIQLQYLASVDDQIAEPASGSEKFADNDAD